LIFRVVRRHCVERLETNFPFAKTAAIAAANAAETDCEDNDGRRPDLS